MNRVELRLILRSRLATASLLLLLVLSALSIWSGLAQVARQEAAIARATTAQASDFAAVAAEYGKPDGDPGYAAYYTFLLTTDRPPPLAFAAVGQRDIQPAVLRVRALGLQQQLYDSETLNPSLALPGVFDWAFVVIYLAPLVVIALAHDLISGEREAGRLRLLLSMPLGGPALWRRRVGLRYLLVLTAVIGPALVAFIATGSPLLLAAGMLVTAALYLAFWLGLSLAIGAWLRTSATNAAALVGCWILLTLLLPTLANAAIARAVPVGKGIELTLAQRELVHKGWDIPKKVTFDSFLARHPEWRGKESFEGRFHWKWYYAMHEAGDAAVAGQVAAYRASLADRERSAEWLGWLLPGVAAQTILHRLADTDLAAQISYANSIAAFHARLTEFLFPYLFRDLPFTRADFDRLPGYVPRAGTASWPAMPTVALLLLTAVAVTFGAFRVRRVGGRSAV